MSQGLDRLLGGIARLMTYLREPDYLYDLHSAIFSILTGEGLFAWAFTHHQTEAWGILITSGGFFRILALAVGSRRLHSASCLISFVYWVFLVWVFWGRGFYVLALIFGNFSISSLIRYMQLEWWKPTGGESAHG